MDLISKLNLFKKDRVPEVVVAPSDVKFKLCCTGQTVVYGERCIHVCYKCGITTVTK